MAENTMKKIMIGKVTVNMGVGETGDALDKGRTILTLVTGSKPMQTVAKVKIPTWGIREGLPIGAKVTLRGKKASEFLKRALSAKDNVLSGKNFDRSGNFGFGIKEYIDLPGTKYDPKLGIRGFDVLVSLERPGYRIKKRKINKKKVPIKHSISKESAITFVKETFGVEIE